MILAVIAISFIVILTVINVSLLFMKVRAVEQLLRDVSLDIKVYERMKRQASDVKAKKLVDKVGIWKK